MVVHYHIVLNCVPTNSQGSLSSQKEEKVVFLARHDTNFFSQQCFLKHLASFDGLFYLTVCFCPNYLHGSCPITGAGTSS